VGANCPIQILEGKYKDIIYRYGKISLKETANEEINVTMEIDVLKAPENFDQQQEDFTNAVGQIFTQIVEEGIEQEPVDLEDDVHQD
jgi:single-stranded DNA-specific DHH superfamily exonuclease